MSECQNIHWWKERGRKGAVSNRTKHLQEYKLQSEIIWPTYLTGFFPFVARCSLCLLRRVPSVCAFRPLCTQSIFNDNLIKSTLIAAIIFVCLTNKKPKKFVQFPTDLIIYGKVWHAKQPFGRGRLGVDVAQEPVVCADV